MHLEGVSVNLPLITEVVDKQEKLEPLLPDLKLIVGDNGLRARYMLFCVSSKLSKQLKVSIETSRPLNAELPHLYKAEIVL